MTAVRPPARFGGLEFDGDLVAEFTEKPQAGEGWINGGFFVFEPEVLDYLGGDDDSLETRRAPAAGGRRPAGRVPARQVLAVHGHAPRQAATWNRSGRRRPAPVEGERMSGFWHDRPTLVTGATGLVGGWVVRRLLAAAGGRGVPGPRLGAGERVRPRRAARSR